MAAGKRDEADAAYKKAVEVSGGTFAVSYNGSAGVQFAKGNWEGGRVLLAKWRENEADPQAKVEADLSTAWSYVAEGKAKEMVAAYDSADKNAVAAKALLAQVESPMQRAEALCELGKYDDAAKALDAVAKADVSKLSPAQQRHYRMRRATLAVSIAARAGKVADADKGLAAVDTEAKADPSNASLQDLAHVAHGEAALAKKDAKAAVAALLQCQEDRTYCQWRLAVAQDAAGDTKGAQATRDRINKQVSRDVMYAYARAKAAKK